MEMEIIEEIKDLVVMAQQKNANYQLLLNDSFNRGFYEGKEFAKKMAIKAIQEEK